MPVFWKCSLVITVITNSMVNIRPTFVEASHRSRHLLGCHWYHRGGSQQMWSSRWSHLRFKRWTQQNFLHSLHCNLLSNVLISCFSHRQVENVEVHALAHHAAPAQVEERLYSILCQDEDKGTVIKRGHTYWSRSNHTVHITKPENISFRQGQWVCPCFKNTHFKN